MNIVVTSQDVPQPKLIPVGSNVLTVAVASLALGGAEKMILDWAARIYPRWKVNVIVLRNQEKEWPVPPFVKVIRLNGNKVVEKLRKIGRALTKSALPVCLCHLLVRAEREALAENGVFAVPVLHNDKAGWPEKAASLEKSAYTIAVSEACAEDLLKNGWSKYTNIIHHLPSPRNFAPGSREHFRRVWRIPLEATVIGMIGAVKPQKDYLFALQVIKKMLETRDVYLTIIGGPIGRHGRATWESVIAEIHRLGLRNRVAMPGFVPDAIQCLPAIDVMLNTSHYEGLSMATLEALVNRKPVVASRVGGQGEVSHEGLDLVSKKMSTEIWVAALEKALKLEISLPPWARFPAYRLWTLAQLARPVKPNKKVLFVTANLNSGGAQRSLVNLASALKGKVKFKIAVAGTSTASYFYCQLEAARVKVFRSAGSRDAFDHAEMLVKKICDGKFGTVCFWNLDPKVKILIVKTLSFTDIRFIDVSPGDNSFDELEESSNFQQLVCFDSQKFYQRLDKLVLKYAGPFPKGCEGKVEVIPNGIPIPACTKKSYSIEGNPRIVVNGRIAPNKFLIEIISAMKFLWKTMPNTELHVFGAAEPRFEEYADRVKGLAERELDRRIFFHGLNFEAMKQLHEFDAFVVLGKNQGCPNALLEAMVAGLPTVGNNDGGTKEQLLQEETGLLIDSRDPVELAAALRRIISDRKLAEHLGRAGKAHVVQNFSMRKMAGSYARLFRGKSLRNRPGFLEKFRSTASEFIKRIIGDDRSESPRENPTVQREYST